MSEPDRRRWRAAAIVAGVVVVVLLLVGGRTAHRAQTSPEACTAGCHVDTAARHYAAVGHVGVTCQSCHPVTPGTGLRLAGSGLVGSKNVRPHGKVGVESCTSCHDKDDAKWERIALTEGHRKHPAGAKLDCLSCHRETSHGKLASAAETCVSCHADARLHKTFDEHKAQCTSCHNFSLPGSKSGAGLVTEACGRCHSAGVQPAGEVVQATVIHRNGLHGGVDCRLCHQPHRKADAPARACKTCHQIQIVASNPHLPKEHITCESCHVQHQPVEAAGARCVKCHEQAKAKADGKKSTALRHDQCASCHLPHTWAAAPNECVTCHNKQASLVLTQSPPQHQRCTNCHEVHGNPPSGAICGTCHKDNAKKMLAGPAKHRDCTSCHNPHAPQVKVPATCAECHKQPLHQLVTLGPPSHIKAGCQTCHTVHGNPKADTKACSTCHKDKIALVAKATKPEHKLCQSCHTPHRFSIDPQSPPCAKCHSELTNAAQGLGAHTGKCATCHVSHGAPTVAREKCLGCHEKIGFKPPPGNADHMRCASCHKPHSKAVLASDKCGTCHGDKAKTATTWPAGSAHRDKCAKCHKPHDIRDKATCASCHEKQQASLGAGKHTCKSCHAVHEARPSDAKGWWGKCASCHAAQVKDVAASKKHDKCANCHAPHKFAKPDCKSCHAAAASTGLHVKKGHADCSKCHQTHSASIPQRNECLTACHADHSNHYPENKLCTGCHVFKL